MVLFGRASFLTGVIAAQSQQRAEKVGASSKIGNVTKKRHGRNFDFFGLKRIARLLNYVEQPCYSFRTKKIKIVAVSFFLNAAFPSIFFLNFDPTSAANNSTLKTARPKKYHIFGILGT